MADVMSDLDKQSLRGFLRQVERELPDEILRVQEPVSTRLDMTSLVFELERAGKSPVVMFENVEGHAMPVVTNVAGNRKLLAACLGVTAADLPTAFRERCQTTCPCELVNRGRVARNRDRGRRRRSHQAADPAAIRGRRRALHHRRPDHGARSRSPASTPPASTA